MANNLQITDPTGTYTIASDEIANVHFQQFKLFDGTENSTTGIPGDGNGLSVQGQVAADAAVAGRPVLEGGRASDAVPSAVSADGDAVHAWNDRRGARKVVVVDDAGDSIMDGVTNSVRVNVVSGSATGTEYTDGSTQATPAGQMVLWWDTSNVVRAVSAAKPFPVNVVAGGTSGVQYDDNVADATPTGTLASWWGSGNAVRATSIAQPMPVQVVTSPGGSVLPDPVVNASAVAVPIKFASINATADGDNTAIAAVAAKKIRVLGGVLTCTGAGTITFKTAATTIGRFVSSANGSGFTHPGGVDAPLFEGGTNENFIITNPAGIDTVGMLTYIEN